VIQQPSRGYAVRKQFLSAAALGGVARAISIVNRFVAVPLTITLLGQEKYGLWLIIGSLIGWLGFSDLGIPAALQNRLIQVLRSEGEERARAVGAFALRLLLGIGAVVFLVGAIVAVTFPWGNVFKIQPGLTGEFSASLVFCLLGFALGMPSRLGATVYNTHARLAMGPLVDILAQTASLGMLLLAVWLRWDSLFALVACSLAGIILGPVFLTWRAMRAYGYGFSGPPPTPADKLAILGKGAFFFLTIIGELLILQSDALVVGAVLGAESVPLLLIPLGLFINLVQGQNILLRPLWPLLAHDYSSGNRAGLTRLIQRTLRLSLALGILFLGACVLLGPWFVNLWSRGLVQLSPTMAIGLGIFGLLGAMDNAINTCLNAFGYIEIRFGYTLLYGVVKVAASIWVLKHMSLVWLPLAYALVLLTCSLPFACWGLVRAQKRIPQSVGV
jgi:O-antigen/teichoic acid export membrane protein